MQGIFFQCWLTQDQMAELDSYLGRKPVSAGAVISRGHYGLHTRYLPYSLILDVESWFLVMWNGCILNALTSSMDQSLDGFLISSALLGDGKK